MLSKSANIFMCRSISTNPAVHGLGMQRYSGGEKYQLRRVDFSPTDWWRENNFIKTEVLFWIMSPPL